MKTMYCSTLASALAALTFSACSMETSREDVSSISSAVGSKPNFRARTVSMRRYDDNSVFLTATFLNMSTVTSTATEIDWYASTDGRIVPGADTLLGTTSLAAISGDRTQQRYAHAYFSYANHSVLSSANYIGAYFDPDNLNIEINERDNARAVRRNTSRLVTEAELIAKLASKNYYTSHPYDGPEMEEYPNSRVITEYDFNSNGTFEYHMCVIANGGGHDPCAYHAPEWNPETEMFEGGGEVGTWEMDGNQLTLTPNNPPDTGEHPLWTDTVAVDLSADANKMAFGSEPAMEGTLEPSNSGGTGWCDAAEWIEDEPSGYWDPIDSCFE